MASTSTNSQTVIIPFTSISDGTGIGPTKSNKTRNDIFLQEYVGDFIAEHSNSIKYDRKKIYQLSKLPDGYGLYQRARSNNPSHIDKTVYGHPAGMMQSCHEATAHIVYLHLHNTTAGCYCVFCNGGRAFLDADRTISRVRDPTTGKTSRVSTPKPGEPSGKVKISQAMTLARQDLERGGQPTAQAGQGRSGGNVSTRKTQGRYRPSNFDSPAPTTPQSAAMVGQTQSPSSGDSGAASPVSSALGAPKPGTQSGRDSNPSPAADDTEWESDADQEEDRQTSLPVLAYPVSSLRGRIPSNDPMARDSELFDRVNAPAENRRDSVLDSSSTYTHPASNSAVLASNAKRNARITPSPDADLEPDQQRSFRYSDKLTALGEMGRLRLTGPDATSRIAYGDALFVRFYTTVGKPVWVTYSRQNRFNFLNAVELFAYHKHSKDQAPRDAVRQAMNALYAETDPELGKAEEALQGGPSGRFPMAEDPQYTKIYTNLLQLIADRVAGIVREEPSPAEAYIPACCGLLFGDAHIVVKVMMACLLAAVSPGEALKMEGKDLDERVLHALAYVRKNYVIWE